MYFLSSTAKTTKNRETVHFLANADKHDSMIRLHIRFQFICLHVHIHLTFLLFFLIVVAELRKTPNTTKYISLVSVRVHILKTILFSNKFHFAHPREEQTNKVLLESFCLNAHPKSKTSNPKTKTPLISGQFQKENFFTIEE